MYDRATLPKAAKIPPTVTVNILNSCVSLDEPLHSPFIVAQPFEGRGRSKLVEDEPAASKPEARAGEIVKK